MGASETPDVEAYRALSEHDAGGAEVRSILDALPTDDLKRVERYATRLSWAARDVRRSREEDTAAPDHPGRAQALVARLAETAALVAEADKDR